jgi:hypothetical protein
VEGEVSAEVLSPEERVERVRMLLAEEIPALDPDDVWWGNDGAPNVERSLPPIPVWRAYALAGEEVACWPCWSEEYVDRVTGASTDCDHDPLTSPWPEVVR